MGLAVIGAVHRLGSCVSAARVWGVGCVLAAGLALPAGAAALVFSDAPGSPVAVGSSPSMIAIGDFNGDGKLDFVVANSGRSVSVMLGDGDGGFSAAPGSPLSAPAQANCVATGDFNGDGKLDLAVCEGNALAILLGDGSGQFSAAPGSPVVQPHVPEGIAVGDLNGDDKLDIALTEGNGIPVLLGDGSGGFSPAAGSPFPSGNNPLRIAVGDFNGDGKLDIVAPNRDDATVSVLLGDGHGTFTAASGSPFSTHGEPHWVAVADLNRDGNLDVAVSTDDGVSVFLGNGSGGFTPAAGSPFAGGDGAVVAADFNGDSEPDLASVNAAGTTVSVLAGDGSGGFTSAPGSPFAVGNGPWDAAVGDFNGDGHPDLAVTNLEDGTASILLNSPATKVTTPPPPPPGAVGVLTNNGDYATNNPHVDVEVVWPPLATQVTLSNDGGFGRTGNVATFPLAAHIPWTLKQTGADRLPKIVYVRFLGAGIDLVTFTDDIILDETAPTLESAELIRPQAAADAAPARTKRHTYRIRVKAKDPTVGVCAIQASNKRHGGTTLHLVNCRHRGIVHLTRTIRVTMHSPPRYVRVKNSAGSWSRWKKLR
jgi:VCBS repeat protein